MMRDLYSDTEGNYIAREIAELLHEGTPHEGPIPHSGRYAYGSGKKPFQHPKDFLTMVEKYKGDGYSTSEIARIMGIQNSTALKAQIANAKNAEKYAEVNEVWDMYHNKGMTKTEIAKKMNYPHVSTVDSKLKTKEASLVTEAQTIKEYLKNRVQEVAKQGGYVDVGKGTSTNLGCSDERLNQALHLLEQEGYITYNRKMPNPTDTRKRTEYKILTPPGTEYSDVFQKLDNNEIELQSAVTADQIQEKLGIHPANGGENILTDGATKIRKAFTYPSSLDSKRIYIRYAEDGGTERDGTIELRPGVKDLSLGNDAYSQVRVLVDDKYYLKGMAVYKDDIPEGYDVVYNSNKHRGTPEEKVFKPVKTTYDEDGKEIVDKDNPFGAAIKERGGQSYYIGDDGKEHLSLINKTKEEGDVYDWKKTVASQFLAKQPTELVKRQINLSKDELNLELDDIMALENNTIKKHYLYKYAESCDKKAETLKTASLPRSHYAFILPEPSLKDTEVYAPEYENGEQVALVRFPHGHISEIPILTVNNKNKNAKKTVPSDSIDAVCINHNTAEKLSGADFDGDTVMIVPLKQTPVKNADQLKDMIGWDNKEAYGGRRTDEYQFKHLSKKDTQKEMGIASNLLTDMNIGNATDSEIARALKYSMVVIDADKHDLDYQAAYKDLGIEALKEKYQPKADGTYGGASTILSRAKSPVRVPKRKGAGIIDKDTGEITYRLAEDAYYEEKKKVPFKDENGKIVKKPMVSEDGTPLTTPTGRPKMETVYETYQTSNGQTRYRYEPTGKIKTNTIEVSSMSNVKDANELVSVFRHPTELAYADYANFCKAKANEARKIYKNMKGAEYHKSAALEYASEVKSLDSKLLLANSNKPLERVASARAYAKANAYAKQHDVSKEDLKKKRQQFLTQARDELGAHKTSIVITDKEWEAIQAGAISDSKLQQILTNSDADKLRERAMPKQTTALRPAQINLIKRMQSSNYTIAEIANRLNLSTTTINKYLK